MDYPCCRVCISICMYLCICQSQIQVDVARMHARETGGAAGGCGGAAHVSAKTTLCPGESRPAPQLIDGIPCANGPQSGAWATPPIAILLEEVLTELARLTLAHLFLILGGRSSPTSPRCPVPWTVRARPPSSLSRKVWGSSMSSLTGLRP